VAGSWATWMGVFTKSWMELYAVSQITGLGG
jgi:hypothetical protein